MIQDFFTPIIFNAAVFAGTYGRPTANGAVELQFPADTTTEIQNDIEWILN